MHRAGQAGTWHIGGAGWLAENAGRWRIGAPVAAEIEAEAGTALTDEDILGCFESLGDNCEFGLVQRTAGIERLGFLRFNSALMPALLRALDSDFAGVDDPDQIEIESDPNNELMVRVRDYQFRYHTFTQTGDVDVAALHAQQVKVIRFLSRKLREDLCAAEKIFVRKGRDSTTADQIAPLVRALRRYGPITLLHVVLQDEAHPCGSVEVVAPGLLRGYIDRFASFDNAFDFSAVWLDICHNAHTLWRDGSPPGTVRQRRKRVVDANLIRQANRFGGAAWWHPSHARAEVSDVVAPLYDCCAVVEHTLSQPTTGETAGVHGCGLAESVAAGSIYVASIWVWLPADFSGTLVGAVFAGFASIHLLNARIALRQAWQRVWVSARTPADVTSANPTLFVIGPAGTRLYSTCWKLELGVQPTDYEPSPSVTPMPPPRAPALPVAAHPRDAPPPGGRAYRLVSLDELHLAGGADARAFLPASELDVPALAFGDTDLGRPGIVAPDALGPGATRLIHPPVAAYLLHDAVVHGVFGIVACGEAVIDASVARVPVNRIPGAAWLEGTRLFLPDRPPAASLPAAYHLLCGDPDRDAHWLLEGLARFDAAEFHGYGLLGEAATAAVLLTPPLDAPWQRQSMALLVPPGLRTGPIAGAMTVRVARLLYLPPFAGAGLPPHRGLLRVFDRMRDAAFAAPRTEPARPFRKLFVSSAGRANPMLVNEAEVAAVAEAAGFARVALDGMNVAEQIRLFAEATHIVAPRGDGLTNLLFCRPGTAVCELQMDRDVQWMFRCLSALRGLRYGCVIGAPVPPMPDNGFRIDPAAVAAVLADRRFAG